MKVAAVLHISDSLKPDDLDFRGLFLPNEIASRLKSVRGLDAVFMAAPSDYRGKPFSEGPTVTISQNTDVEFWKGFFKETEYDHAVKIGADSPFLDPAIIGEMLNVHLKYMPEYTYSENVPSGFCGEIISRELIESVPESNPNDEKKPLPLSQVIKTNIHQFDVEIYYAHPDVRDRRLSFRSGSPRDRRVMENIYDGLGKFPGYAEIAEVLAARPEVIHVAPSYVEVELTGRCGLDCVFCYRKTLRAPHGDMDIEVFRKIVRDMDDFTLPYALCLGGSGEPLMHGSFYEAMETAFDSELLTTVVVETNGLLADANFAGFIAGRGAGKGRVIVNINGKDGETYRALHGEDHFERVVANVELLRKELPGPEQLYVQIMKINETEKYLDAFYDFWDKKGVPIILQKQNTYMGRTQDRRYSDLSPLERIPCWHLQRDLYILHDGTVAFCKQDVDGLSGRGNVKDAPLGELFGRGRADFIDNYRGKLSAAPDCASCDEWYTFNL